MQKTFILLFLTLFALTSFPAHSQLLYYWQDDKGQLHFSTEPVEHAAVINIRHHQPHTGTAQSKALENYRQVIKNYFVQAAHTPYCRNLSGQLDEFKKTLETRMKNGLTGMDEFRLAKQIKRLGGKIKREC